MKQSPPPSRTLLIPPSAHCTDKTDKKDCVSKKGFRFEIHAQHWLSWTFQVFYYITYPKKTQVAQRRRTSPVIPKSFRALLCELRRGSPVSASHTVCGNWVRMRQKIFWEVENVQLCLLKHVRRRDWLNHAGLSNLEAENIYIHWDFSDEDISVSITSIALREQRSRRWERTKVFLIYAASPHGLFMNKV